MKDNVTVIVPKNTDAIAEKPNESNLRPAIKPHGMDFVLFITVVIICAFGLVMLFSASYYYAQNQFGDGFKYLKSQAGFTALGIALMLLLSFVNYSFYKKNIVLAISYAAVIFMLAMVIVPGLGIERQGARRWLGIRSLTVQPSEFVRFILVLILAKYMSENMDFMPYFLNGTFPALLALGSVLGVAFVCAYEKTKEDKLLIAAAVIAALVIVGSVIWYFIARKEIWRTFKKTLRIYALIIVPCIFIYLQPNLSTLILIAFTVITMLFIGGASPRYLSAIVFIGVGLILLMIFAEDYRHSRILAWFNPWKYPSKEGFQVVQSLYALGSGGLFGQGFNASRQKLLFLPYRESDFIFAIICEEFGFFGGFLLIAAYGLIIYRGIRIAQNIKDKFASMVAAGITSILAIQVILNISVVTGFLPATGQTLPFISAGGTSAIVFLAAMGMLLNISRFTEIKKR